MKKTLTAKEQAFVEEYLVDLNATKAAERAGYSKKNSGQAGANVLSREHVQKAIQQAKVERSERTQLTQDMVVDGLLGEARAFGEGSSHGARVSAWTQLGKHLGMFTDKVDMNHNGGVSITIGFHDE